MDVGKWKAPAALWGVLLVFAACADRIVPDAALPASALREAAAAPPPPANPVATSAPASVPAPAAPPTDAMPRGSAPAPGTVGYGGFGPAAYGDSVERLRMAWGQGLEGAPSEVGGCHYLTPVGGTGIAFMVENAVFLRTDVSRADVDAPGGGRIGLHADAIKALYGPAVDVRPHEYAEGARLLRVADPAGGPGVLVFETDAAGAVVAWRTGIAPQVDYSEGCG